LHILSTHSVLMYTCVASTFWLFWIMLLGIFLYTFFFVNMCFFSPQYIPRRIVGWYDDSMFYIWGTTKQFFKVVSPFYIPTLSLWGFWLLHTLIIIFFDYSPPAGEWSDISLWFSFAFL
jgi:hypothetical protein